MSAAAKLISARRFLARETDPVRRKDLKRLIYRLTELTISEALR